MLRYRFDDLGQLSRHLHVVDHAAVIFLRDHRRDVHYERVLLELEIHETGENVVVRGEVVSRADARIRGAWLRLCDTRLARRLREPAALSSRRLPRVSTDRMIGLRRGSGDHLVAQLLDVSPVGLRVRGARGLALGESCDARLIGAPVVTSDLGCAQVVRVEGDEAGLRFTSAENVAVRRLVQSLQQAWRLAPELDHIPECCAEGRPIEPAPPDLRRACLVAT
jgi:hypothetical protein